MAVNIQQELERKLKEGQQREMSLSDRLSYLDNYNKDVAVPQISSQGPTGYNPMNSLNALFQMITNRKGVSQDLASQSDSNFNVLDSLASYEKQNQPEAIDPIKLLELDLKAKEQGLKFDPETLSFTEDKTKPKATGDVLDVAKKIRTGNFGKITGAQNPFALLMPGTEEQLLKNQYNQLKGLLSLENRQKLKGSGAISDYESKVLDKAASHLGRNLSNSQFQAVLDEMIAGLEGEEEEKGDKGTDPLGIL